MQNYIPRVLCRMVREYINSPKQDFDNVLAELLSPMYIYDNVVKQLTDSTAQHFTFNRAGNATHDFLGGFYQLDKLFHECEGNIEPNRFLWLN